MYLENENFPLVRECIEMIDVESIFGLMCWAVPFYVLAFCGDIILLPFTLLCCIKLGKRPHPDPLD